MNHCEVTAHSERPATENQGEQNSRDNICAHRGVIYPKECEKEGKEGKHCKKNRKLQYPEYQIRQMQVMLPKTYIRHAELPCRLFDNQRQTNIESRRQQLPMPPNALPLIQFCAENFAISTLLYLSVTQFYIILCFSLLSRFSVIVFLIRLSENRRVGVNLGRSTHD